MSFVNHKGWWKAKSNNSLSIVCLSIYLSVSPYASLPDCLGVSVSNVSLACLSHCPYTPQLGSLPTSPPACQSFYLIACLFGQSASFFCVCLSPCGHTYLLMSLSMWLPDWQSSFGHLQVLSCLIFIHTNKDRLTKDDLARKYLYEKEREKQNLRFRYVTWHFYQRTFSSLFFTFNYFVFQEIWLEMLFSVSRSLTLAYLAQKGLLTMNMSSIDWKIIFSNT